jgi:hypothetical protein
MLDVSSGVNLTATGRKSLGNRHFGYTVSIFKDEAQLLRMIFFLMKSVLEMVL